MLTHPWPAAWRRSSRRRFVAGGLALAGTVAFGLVQACGSPATPAAPSSPAQTPGAVAQTGPVSGPPAAAVPPAPPAGPPQSGGSLTVGVVVDPTDDLTSLDPHRGDSLARQRLTQLLYSRLVQTDASLHVQPELAQSWEVAPDGQTYTFRLRQGVRFHNGREVTAIDVGYSIERTLDPSIGSGGARLLRDIARIETPDPYTVRLRLARPGAGLLAGLASPWGAVVAKEEIEKASGDLTATDAGSGPYLLADWSPGQFLKVKRRPDAPVADQPYLDTITYQVSSDPGEVVELLRAGTLDLAQIDEPGRYEQVRRVQTLVVTRTPRLDTVSVSVNFQVEPWNRVEARQALSYAIDRATVLQQAAAGLGAVCGPIPPAMAAYALDASTLPEYRQDLNRAQTLLAAAGLANGVTVTLTVPPGDSLLLAAAEAVAEQARPAGIDLTIAQDAASWQARVDRRQFSLAMGRAPGDTDPDALLYDRLRSGDRSRPASGVSGQLNDGTWHDDEADRLLDAGRASVDTVQRQAVYAQLQRLLVERAPRLWLFSPDIVTVSRERVAGYEPHPSALLPGLVRTWINQ